MKKIISFNANGIRSAARKDFFTWLAQEDPDILCLQETKAQRADLIKLDHELFHPDPYFHYFSDADKKGYSGVAIYTKQEPLAIHTKLEHTNFDTEGRYLQIDFADFKVTSLYLPSGTSGELRQKIKYELMDFYFEVLKQQIQDPIPHIICGDWNIAHTKQDIKNWQSNQKSSGFLPEERAWLDRVFGELGFIDAYRYHNPDKIEYTWWSHRAKAWENNVGWRIDYQVISPQLKDKIISTRIYRGHKFSDHAPLIFEYDI